MVKNMIDLKTEKIAPLIDKLKKDKKTLLIIVISFLGVFLIFLSEFMPSEDSEAYDSNVYDEHTDFNAKEALERIIGKIEGVGKVEVLVAYEGSAETVYASDKSEQSKASETKTEQEHIILDKGNTEDGLRLKEIYPKVIGVAVVCEGGGNPKVKNEITQMLRALFSINSNNISISEMNG